jgi:acetyl esterase/lipase
MFAGDSAGGSMALALCHALRDADVVQPSSLLMFSPWLDVRIPAPEAEAVARIDPCLNIDHLREVGTRYAGGDPLDTPLVSPGVGALTGLPPMTVFTGSHDVLDRGMHCWVLMRGRHTGAAFEAMRTALG